MKLLSLLLWLRCLRRGTAVTPAARAGAQGAPTAPPAPPPAPDDEAPRGCGWFDSSHELQQGLKVQEHHSADTLGTELPLGAWLELQLRGWRASATGQDAVCTPAA